MSEPTHSALIITVPEAEPVVGAHRDRHDRAAAWGVPAHVTVLFPFITPQEVTDDVVLSIAAAVGTVPAFNARFDRTRWFGEEVLYVAPSQVDPFIALTHAAAAAFPDHQPYGGAHDDVVPHLTVAHGAPPEVLRDVESDVQPRLPIATDVTAVDWWFGSEQPHSGQWFRALALRARPPV